MEIGWDELLVDDSSKGIFDMELGDQDMPGHDTEIVGEEVIYSHVTNFWLLFHLIFFLGHEYGIYIVMMHYVYYTFSYNFYQQAPSEETLILKPKVANQIG